MGNCGDKVSTTFDTTISGCVSDPSTSDMYIKCNPTAFNTYIILQRHHHNFPKLYAKIKSGNSYTMKVYEVGTWMRQTAYVVDIYDVRSYIIEEYISGLLDLEIENINDYVEILTNIRTMRLLLDKESSKNVKINNKYKITYQKFLHGNFYKVIQLTEI
jgi:hypothetical protein